MTPQAILTKTEDVLGVETPAPINRLSFSKDNKSIISFRDDGTYSRWNFTTNEETNFDEPPQPLSAVSLDASQGITLTENSDGIAEVVLWDLPKKKRIASIISPGVTFFDALFSSDQKSVVLLIDNYVYVWEVTENQINELKAADGSSIYNLIEIAQSSTRGLVIYSSELLSYLLFRLPATEVVQEIPYQSLSAYIEGPMEVFAFLPGTETIVFAGNEVLNGEERVTLVFWDTNRKSVVKRLYYNERFEAWQMRISLDARWVALVQERGSPLLWDLKTGAATLLTGASRNSLDVVFSGDSKLLAAGGSDGFVRVWDVSAPQNVRSNQTKTGHTEKVTALCPIGDGELLSGGADGALLLWDLASKKESARLFYPEEQTPLTKVVCSRDGALAAALYEDDLIVVWDIKARKARYSFPFLGAMALSLSPDASQLFVANQDLVASFRTDQRKRLWLRELHNDAVPLLAPTEESLFTTRTYSIQQIEPKSGELREQVALYEVPVRAMGYSPEGRSLFVLTESFSLCLWLGRSLLGCGEEYDTYAGSFVFSPDGRRLLSISESAVVGWDTTSGERLFRSGPGIEQSSGAAVLAKDGSLWVGTTSGAIWRYTISVEGQ